MSASCVLVAALLLSVIRFWVLPRAASQRPELERQIGRLIGETVSIGAVNAHVHGIHPEFVLTDFRIVDARGGTGIRFETVRVGVHPLNSLMTHRLQPAWVKIHGTRLSLQRQPDGSLAVLGLSAFDHPPAWLLAAERIELLDGHIDWQDLHRGRPPIDLGRADLRLANAGERHQLNLSVRWAEGDENGLQVRADLVGNLLRKDRWAGRIYLEGAGLSAVRLNGLLPWVSRLRSGSAGFRVWSDWASGEMTRLAGRIELRQPTLALSAASDQSSLKLARLESWFRWRESKTDTFLHLEGLRLSPLSGAAGPPSRVSLGLERDEAGQIVAWRVTASRLRLADVGALPDSLPALSEPARRLIRDTAGQGELRDLSMVYRSAANSGNRLAFCGELDDLRLKASGVLPGLSRVHGSICGSERSGALLLRSVRSDLDVPMWSRTPIRVKQAQLAARWNRDGHLLRVESDGFTVATADFTVQGRGTVELPDDPGIPPRLDLQATASEVGVRALAPYLPDVMFPETARYLASALTGGRVARAEMRVQGPFEAFPFEERQGLFEAVLDVRSLDLLYDSNWPPVQGLDGRLRFSGSHVEFDAERGRTGNGDITKLRGVVPSLTREPRLSVEGMVRASAADAMAFMMRTPVHRIPSGLLQLGSLSGDAEISLGLTVPIDQEPGHVRVAGSATLQGAAIAFRDVDVKLGPLRGDLAFTESGLQALELSGVLLNEPVTIAAASKDGALEISADGRAHTATLQRALPSELWRVLSGDGAYHLTVGLSLPSASTKSRVAWTFRSDLRGVQVDLPAPLGKPAATPTVLELSGRFEPGNRVPVRLSYDGRLQGSLLWSSAASGWRLDRGRIALGCELPKDGGLDGLTFVGRLSRVDVTEWERFARDFRTGGDDQPMPWEHLQADLEARELWWAGRNLGAVKFTLAKRPSRWQGTVEGDLAAGRFLMLPGRTGYPSLDLDLERVVVPRGAGGGSSAPSLAATDPRTLPGIRLRSRRVLWKDVDLGALSLIAERQSLGLILKEGELKGDRHRLRVAGDWLASAGKSRMRLNGQATADSLGELAARLGAGAKIQDTRSAVDFQLSWPGSPFDMGLPSLEGEVAVRMEEGSLLEIDPGWSRMFGFLNVSSVWRRINLDFRDLLNDGLAYDRIEGKFRIGEGKAVTSGFLIDGVATRIVIDGSADLATETLDQVVTVIPRTSVALPIAGTLAGGPAVGAAIFVAQELVGEQVDSLTAIRYRATGPWDNPNLRKMDGNMPMELLGRAWSGLKRLSGGGQDVEEQKK